MKVRLFVLPILVLAASVSTSALDWPRESRWAKLDGTKIHYYDIGNQKTKNAIVFVHGWTCNTDFWKFSLDAFPGKRVIVLDLPGHGKSDKPKVDYSMEYFARSVDAVMKQAGVDKAVLVGHSMGTPITREFYRMHPEQTLGIVIVDGSLTPFPKAVADQLIGSFKADYKAGSAKFVDGIAATIKVEGLRRYVREVMLSVPDYVAISAMEGMTDEKIWKDDKINVPVLAIMAQSPFLPPDVKDVFTRIAPNIDFQMWSGVSHFLQMEKPTEFNEAVGAFIAKNKLL